MNNNLFRFDFVNRILIHLQNNEALDLRTLQEWELLDRDIKEKAKCVYIINIVDNNVYIDTMTDKEIGNDDLTVNEIPFALKYNIIKRQNKANEITITKLYDISDTKNTHDEKNNLKRFCLSTSKLLELTKNILSCTIINSDMTYYSKTNNTLNICKSSYEDIVSTVSDLIVKHFINNRINTSESDNEIELVEHTLLYSLKTLFNVEADIDFDVLRKLDVNSIIDVLSINDDFIEYILSYIEYESDNVSVNSNNSISRIKKAVFILDLMEANEMYKGIHNQ